MNTQWEAIVVGSGLAGLCVALSLAPKRTLLVTKTSQLEGGSTVWAQGGIAFPQGKDDIPLHKADTLASGAGKASEEAVSVLLENAEEALRWLEGLGLVFDHDENGYLLGQEGAHSIRRILHLGGDATGREISRFLAEKVKIAPHITILDSAYACKLEIITTATDSRLSGLWIQSKNEGLQFLASNEVYLAGGGLGQLFASTTNPAESTGDALVLAQQAGIVLKDMEMIQFHPTALDIPQTGFRPQLPLLSEALRGEGAQLVYWKNEKPAPLPIPHPQGNLGPRDIVARSLFLQVQNGFAVGLDARNIPNFERRFPTILQICQKNGLDPRKEILPVIPAVHYTMGGIPTDHQGKTSITGLWAVGECACTGVHGANRLASNSLLECLVFARQAAKSGLLSSKICPPSQKEPLISLLQPGLPQQPEVSALEQELQNLMFESAGSVRDQQTLQKGLQQLKELSAKWRLTLEQAAPTKTPTTFEQKKAVFELNNLFTLAHTVLDQALANPQSCGAHFRRDSLS